MTLTCELELDSVTVNQRANCLGQRPFCSKVIIQTHRLICCTCSRRISQASEIVLECTKLHLLPETWRSWLHPCWHWLSAVQWQNVVWL